MSIRLATLASVAAVAITAMIKEINADQHLPLTNSAVGNSAQAAELLSNRPCGCSHRLESSAPSPAPPLRSNSADYFELELKKLRQAIIDAEAQRERADKERKRLENELNDIKRQLTAVPQLQTQKDAQIDDLRGQLAGAPRIAAPSTKTPATPQALGRPRSGPIAPAGSNDPGRTRRTKSAVQFFREPSTVDCVRGVRPLHHYGPYEMLPLWDDIRR
jgi:hypothetical protein